MGVLSTTEGNPIRRIALPIVGAVVVLALLFASPSTALRPTIAPDPCLGHSTTAAKFRPWSKSVWRLIRWERGKPPAAVIATQRLKVKCAIGPGHRAAIRHRWREDQRVYFRHRHRMRELIALTPYDCGSAGRFAIPCAVVACESGYSWSAVNASGAAGPYQIMPEWGRPWPITSIADKLAHHRLAAEIWAGGSGASNWVCA